MGNEYLSTLIEISRAKKECLREMLMITEEQGKIIELQDIEQLNKLIDEKQKRIDEINSMDDRFEDLFSTMKTQLGLKDVGELLTAGNEGLKELKGEISEIKTIVEDIKLRETQNFLMLNQKKKEVSKKLKDVKNNKAALNKYANSKPSTSPKPAFFDKKK